MYIFLFYLKVFKVKHLSRKKITIKISYRNTKQEHIKIYEISKKVYLPAFRVDKYKTSIQFEDKKIIW